MHMYGPAGRNRIKSIPTMTYTFSEIFYKANEQNKAKRRYSFLLTEGRRVGRETPEFLLSEPTQI